MSADSARELYILHVDDDDTNRFVMQHLLVMLGHRPRAAGSAADALTALQGPEAFDVVLTDIHMPDMTGVEMLRDLLAGARAGTAPPVLAVTADVLSLGPADYQALGFAGVVAKPFAPDVIASALAAAVGGCFHVSGFRPTAA